MAKADEGSFPGIEWLLCGFGLPEGSIEEQCQLTAFLGLP